MPGVPNGFPWMMFAGQMGMQPAIPVLEITGNTAYLLRADQIVKIDITVGKVLAQTNLRAPKAPAPPEQ
jgi:hypothetical protein